MNAEAAMKPTQTTPILLKSVPLFLFLSIPFLLFYLCFQSPTFSHLSKPNTTTTGDSEIKIRPGYSTYESYIQRQLNKTLNPKLRQIWTTRDWDRKIKVFARFFSDLKEEGLLRNSSRTKLINSPIHLIMRKNRGLKLRRKLLLRLFNFNWIFHRKNLSGYRRIDSSGAQPANSGGGGSKLFNWGRLLRRRAKELFFLRFQNHNRGYIRVGTEPYYDEREGGEGKRAVEVPKGHLAVCVGEREEEAHKVVVPIIYLNHPLFGELLKEAEEEYGFDHAGQIMLPCPMSKFQTVQMRISAGEKCARSTPPHRPPLPRHHHRV